MACNGFHVIVAAIAVSSAGAVTPSSRVVRRMHVESNGQLVERRGMRHQQDEMLKMLREARADICSTFPGNICDAIIKGAHAPQAGASVDSGSQIRAALRRKMESGTPFVFASFGSSVTAGHDNHYNTSWPFELERILKPTFEKAGFGFELRQRAVGGYSEAPYTAGCMQNRAGTGIDAVSWEWWMFGDPACAGEGFMREAYSINGAKQAPPVIMSVESTTVNIKMHRTGIADEEAPKIRNATFSYLDLEGSLDKRRWKPNKWYLTEEFISKQEVATFAKELKQRSHASLLMKAKSKAGQWADYFARQCEGLTGKKPNKEQQAAIDQAAAALAKKEKPLPYLMKKGVAQPFVDAGFGFESFFSTSGVEEVPREWRPWYLAREKAFNINWHPGPLGHLLIASQLAHYMLSQTILMLQEGRQNYWEAMSPPVAPPLGKCGAGVPRHCATGMHPHNGLDISDVVVPKNSWPIELSQDQGGLMENIDKRMPIRVGAGDNPLQLSVQAQKEGDIAVVCMSPCAWLCHEHKGLITVATSPTSYWPPRLHFDPKHPDATNTSKPAVNDADFSLDGQSVSTEKLIEMNEKVFGEHGSFCAGCEIYTRVCQAVGELQGAHQLSVKVSPKTDPDDKDMYLEILQVMVVPGAN